MNTGQTNSEIRWLKAALYHVIQRAYPWLTYPILMDAVKAAFAHHVIDLREQGLTMREIAAVSNVTTTTLNNLLNRRPRQTQELTLAMLSTIRDSGAEGATFTQLIHTASSAHPDRVSDVNHIVSGLMKAGRIRFRDGRYRLSVDRMHSPERTPHAPNLTVTRQRKVEPG